MYTYLARWTILAGLEVADDTTLTECVQTFNDGGGVHEVSGTQTTHDVRVQRAQLDAFLRNTRIIIYGCCCCRGSSGRFRHLRIQILLC